MAKPKDNKEETKSVNPTEQLRLNAKKAPLTLIKKSKAPKTNRRKKPRQLYEYNKNLETKLLVDIENLYLMNFKKDFNGGLAEETIEKISSPLAIFMFFNQQLMNAQHVNREGGNPFMYITSQIVNHVFSYGSKVGKDKYKKMMDEKNDSFAKEVWTSLANAAKKKAELEKEIPKVKKKTVKKEK